MHIHMMTQPLQAAQANFMTTLAVQPVLPQQQFQQQHQQRQPQRQYTMPLIPQPRFQQYLKQSLQLYPQQHRQQNL